MLFPTAGPQLSAQRELAYTYIGASLLVLGFVLQLVGYVIDANNYLVHCDRGHHHRRDRSHRLVRR